MEQSQAEADCDECENGTVRPRDGGLEYVCDTCDAKMSSSRFCGRQTRLTRSEHHGSTPWTGFMPQGYGTIKLPRNDYERHNDRRKSMGLTWAEYIDGQAPDIQTDAAVDYSEIEARCQEAVESALERPRFEELLEGRQDGGQDNE